MSIETLLSRLDGVKETGHGKYVARCPAHEDRSPSLAIKDEEDGRVLLHCFAGCETEDVLNAIGLTFSDVMPERIETSHSYKPRRWLNARDALSSLDHEALVVSVIAADFLRRKAIDDETWDRLASATHRINKTRADFAPARIGK